MKPILIFILLVTGIFKWSVGQALFEYEGQLCSHSTIQFTDLSVSADSWLWNFDDGETSDLQNPEHIFTDSGVYNVRLTISNAGVERSINQLIPIHLPPAVNFEADTSALYFSSYSRLFIDHSICYNAQPVSFHWNFGNGHTVITDTQIYAYKYDQSGEYTVWHKVIDSNGCTDSISQLITITDNFIVPNVFTPNEDLINDQFIVISNGITLFEIDIYSRWGNLVFSRSGTQQIIWDGRLPGGEKVKPGTYFYVISAQTGNVTYESETGFVTVFY